MKDNINYTNILIAHRGIYDNITIPENSIKAFKLSLKKSIPIELDLQLTKDNKIVVFHDENLNRMTGTKGKIKNYNYEDLKKLKLLNTNERIPLLSEVLKIVDNKVLLDIEIKKGFNTKKMMNELFNLLDKTNQKYIIKSFDLRYLFWLKKNRPNVIRGILASKYKKLPWYKRIINYPSSHLLGVNLVKPDFIAYNLKYINYKKLERLKRKGIKILAWTIKNEELLNKAKKYKVDGFIADSIWNIKE